MNDITIITKMSNLITEVMGIKMSEIELDKELADISEWDSFNNLMLLSKAEILFGVKFTLNDIDDATTVNKVYNLVIKKVGEKENDEEKENKYV